MEELSQKKKKKKRNLKKKKGLRWRECDIFFLLLFSFCRSQPRVIDFCFFCMVPTKKKGEFISANPYGTAGTEKKKKRRENPINV